MSILIILAAVVGVAVGQQGDLKDCEPRHSAVSVRDVQDIYQRPVGYDTGDYTPHSTYGPPEPVRPPPRRVYTQEPSEGASAPQPAFIQPPGYPDIRQQFPLAPVYGPPPPRAKVAAAAGIYDDLEDIQYAPQPAQAALIPVVRRYNINYAQTVPYQPAYGYGAYATRHHEYRVPLYYAPVPEGYQPIRLAPPSPPAEPATTTTTTTTTTEAPHTHPAPVTIPITQPISYSENTVYEENQVRRHPPIVAVTSSEEDTLPRHKFRKPFSGLANLFRGSIIATRNKIGAIPGIVQGSVNKFT